MTKEKLWTKDFISITVISFFIFLAFYVLLTALPLYLVGNLHAGADKVGLVVTLFLGAAIVIRPFAGKWVSKGSQKKILVYSAIAFLVGTLLYPFATNIWALFILRIFHGITFGIITTVKGTICAELIPSSRRGEGLSYFSLAMCLAMVFGPYIGLNLANIDAYNTAFVICMAISVVTVAFAFFLKVPENKKQAGEQKSQKFSWNDLVDKKAAPYALATFILACAYSGISAFLSLYAKGLGLVEAASYFFIVYAVFILIFRPFTGRWSDQYGSKIIIYPCLVLFAIGMFMLNQTHTGAMMIIAGAVIGIGYGSITPIFQTLTISAVEPHRVGIANSLFFNSMDAGMAIGAYGLGMIATGAGYRSVFLAGGILIIIAGLLYFAQTKNKQQIQTKNKAVAKAQEQA
jgi:predicted MFS family arabinose efflux permease